MNNNRQSYNAEEKITALYCRLSRDDGYSGTTFDRPDWNRLMGLVDEGRVGTIIVKDMSRLGRDYLKVGMYTETLWTRTQKADRETGC